MYSASTTRQVIITLPRCCCPRADVTGVGDLGSAISLLDQVTLQTTFWFDQVFHRVILLHLPNFLATEIRIVYRIFSKEGIN